MGKSMERKKWHSPTLTDLDIRIATRSGTFNFPVEGAVFTNQTFGTVTGDNPNVS